MSPIVRDEEGGLSVGAPLGMESTQLIERSNRL